MSSRPSARTIVDVCASWPPLSQPVLVGALSAIHTRGKEVFSFEYDEAWLASTTALALDPRLGLHRGAQYPSNERGNFGVFLDSVPDRWGRALLERCEGLRARLEGREPRTLGEIDYLLGVYDGHRLGALRYRRPGETPFLDDDAQLASPPWPKLRELQMASARLESKDAEDDPQFAKWLGLLIAPGRSLGGARPKASVVDSDGALWIAKFPSAHDAEDVGAWEAVAHELARLAGVETASSRVEKLRGPHHTFLSRRFDRTDKGAPSLRFRDDDARTERRRRQRLVFGSRAGPHSARVANEGGPRSAVAADGSIRLHLERR